MRRMKAVCAFVLGLIVAAVPAAAHHSFAMFDQTKTVTLTGTIKESNAGGTLSMKLALHGYRALEGTTAVGLEQANAEGNVQGIARLLFTKYVFAFEVTSALLITAAVGALFERECLGIQIGT